MKRVLIMVCGFVVSIAVAQAQAPAGAQRGAPGAATAGAPGAPADAAGRGRGGGGRGALAGRIVSFEANPTSIKAGESFVLSWQTESGNGSIDNGIGAIAPRGTIRVSPKATTTYTLSIGGVTRAVTVKVEGSAPAATTNQTAGPRPIPRADGKPDFSGIYGSSGFPARGNATQGPTSPFDGLPAQPTIKPGAVNRGAAANPSGGTSDCLPLPADSAFGVPYPFQIIQSKDYVVIFNEYPGTFRIVPLDGQPHPADPDPTWMGDSIGKWEGDTLVIDTVGYNGKHAIGGIQQPSEQFHTIERLTRTSATAFYYEIVYEDPEFATGKWRATRMFNADTRAGVNKIMEFVCENNRDYTPLFGPQGPQPAGGAGGGGARGGRGN